MLAIEVEKYREKKVRNYKQGNGNRLDVWSKVPARFYYYVHLKYSVERNRQGLWILVKLSR